MFNNRNYFYIYNVLMKDYMIFFDSIGGKSIFCSYYKITGNFVFISFF